MSLKIIGSGFGRTGTASMKLALEILDFGPCHHMEEVLQHPEQVAHWQAIATGKPVNWEVVFAGYRAQMDWPGAHVWRELAAAYPDAKVIHTFRPEEQWWKSFSATIGTLLSRHKDLPAPPHVRAMVDATYQMICVQTMNGSVDRESALAAYRRREADVLAAISPERLLVFDVAQGWEPLCRFLGVPVPSVPFPRVNSTEEFWQVVKENRP
jgi:hypothetical protein